MRAAAATVAEVSALYGYLYPEHAQWSARELLVEAVHVEDEAVSGVSEVTQ